jgi:autotransporter-associated beta strand protein
VVSNSASGTVATLNVNQSTVTSFSGSINDGLGRAALSLEGGTLVLAGSNGYSGGTTVYSDSGTVTPPVLQMGASNALPYGSGKGDVFVSGAGTLDLAGNLTNINGLWGNGTVDSTLGSATLFVGNGDATSTFSGVLQNSNSAAGALLALTKVGSGSLTLSGTNTYMGGTTVENGTLVLTNNEAIADGTSLTVGDLSAFAAPVVPAHAAATAIAPVPEPGTLALIAALLGSAVVCRRIRRTYSSRSA